MLTAKHYCFLFTRFLYFPTLPCFPLGCIATLLTPASSPINSDDGRCAYILLISCFSFLCFLGIFVCLLVCLCVVWLLHLLPPTFPFSLSYIFAVLLYVVCCAPDRLSIPCVCYHDERFHQGICFGGFAPTTMDCDVEDYRRVICAGQGVRQAGAARQVAWCPDDTETDTLEKAALVPKIQ